MQPKEKKNEFQPNWLTKHKLNIFSFGVCRQQDMQQIQS